MTQIATNKARATIYDVAREAGVSKSLVSLVIKNDPRVSETRRKLVETAIAKLHYTPSRAATTLAGKASKSIGVLVDDYTNLWFVQMIAGLRSVFDEAGYQITISDVHEHKSILQSPVGAFRAMHVDGLIVAAEPHPDDLKLIDMPAVIVGDRHLDLAGVDMVTNDDYNGAIKATNRLISLGHTLIGHLATSSNPGKERQRGYEDAMKRAGLKTVIVPGAEFPSAQFGYETAKVLFETEPKITAVFASNDTIAGGAVSYMNGTGRRVPEDISVIGFDNSPIASKYLFNLTTVTYAGEDIGLEAARLLLARIADPEKKPKRVVMPSTLVIRNSAQPLTN